MNAVAGQVASGPTRACPVTARTAPGWLQGPLENEAKENDFERSTPSSLANRETAKSGVVSTIFHTMGGST